MGNHTAGMSRNPFGGHMRLDRLDLTEYAQPGDPPEKFLYLTTITDAIHNYCFFGLGRNGTTASEFAFACEYLFRVRSTQPEGWQKSRLMQDGNRTIYLSEAQMQEMCFDVHYEYSGLVNFMPMDRFLSWLKEKRRRLIEDNQEQVFDYIQSLYERACAEAAPGHQLPLLLIDRVHALTSPHGPEEVASMVYLPDRYLHPINEEAMALQ